MVWVLADDRPGNVGQALGVAQALGVDFVEKSIRYDRLARLPNLVRGATLMGVASGARAQLVPPWPRLVIAAGRRTAPIARWIKAQSRRQGRVARLVQIMDPGPGGRDDFDLIAIPRHDGHGGMAADSVLPITGAPHRMDASRLAMAAQSWEPRWSHLPRPWLGVIVGGATRHRPFTPDMAETLAKTAARLAAERGGSLLVTTSRRTGAEAQARLLAHLPEPRFVHCWDQGGDNPYAGILALSDLLLVTGDSVSMVCEACAAPAPVLIFAPPGFADPKHVRLHDRLFADGLAHALAAPGDPWSLPPHAALNAAHDIARIIRGKGWLE